MVSFFAPTMKGDLGWAVALLALAAFMAPGAAKLLGLLPIVNLLVPFAPLVMRRGKTNGALLFTLVFLAGTAAPLIVFFPYDGLQVGFYVWEASLLTLSVGLAKRTWW